MMRPAFVSCAVLVGALSLGQSAAAPAVAITAEPSHHLVLENKWVRVFKVEVAPKSATLLHQHDHDYIFVSLGASDITNKVEGKEPVERHLEDGEARLVKGGFAHVATNRAATPFRNVTVEILMIEPQKPGVKPVKVEPSAGATSKLLFDTEVVRAWDITLEPGATLPRHERPLDHLIAAVTDLELRSQQDFRAPDLIHQKAGDVAWVRGGFAHSLSNVGTGPARWVELEFK